MNESSPIPIQEVELLPDFSTPPPRPGFGFLLGGTTLGILFGCVLLCAGASPPHVIIIVLSICGAITGGLLESLWPKPIPQPKPRSAPRQKSVDKISMSPFREGEASPSIQRGKRDSQHECQRCGEVFEPSPIVCPMCGHSGKNRRSR